jgi:hypothetical protein
MSALDVYFVEKVLYVPVVHHVTKRMTYRNDVYPRLVLGSLPDRRSSGMRMDDECWEGTGRKLEEMLRGYRRGMRMQRGVTTLAVASADTAIGR